MRRSLHKYMRTARRQGGVEIKSMIDLVLVKRDMLRYAPDVRVVRGIGRGLSDHHVVQCKIKLVGAWIKKREVVAGARRIRSKNLRQHQYSIEKDMQGLLRGREWNRMEIIMSSICGSR